MSVRGVAFVLLALITPWVLRYSVGGAVTSESPIPLHAVAQIHGAIEVWGNKSGPLEKHVALRPQNASSGIPTEPWKPRSEPTRDLRRLHQSRLVFKESMRSRRRAELLERKFRRSLRAERQKMHDIKVKGSTRCLKGSTQCALVQQNKVD